MVPKYFRSVVSCTTPALIIKSFPCAPLHLRLQDVDPLGGLCACVAVQCPLLEAYVGRQGCLGMAPAQTAKPGATQCLLIVSDTSAGSCVVPPTAVNDVAASAAPRQSMASCFTRGTSPSQTSLKVTEAAGDGGSSEEPMVPTLLQKNTRAFKGKSARCRTVFTFALPLQGCIRA